MMQRSSMQGKLIVIEGIDGSGKRTQWRLLVEKLQAVGVDFPRYKQSMAGKLLKELLLTEDFQKLTPYLATLPYVIDQYLWWREEGKQQMAQGKWIIANRYVTSNVHQIYKLKGRKRNEFGKWFWKFVYQELGLPKPDLVLVLDVVPQVSTKLQETRNKRRDEADKDYAYQVAAYKGYKDMCGQEKNWVLVPCMDKNRLLTRVEINDRIEKILAKKKWLTQ